MEKTITLTGKLSDNVDEILDINYTPWEDYDPFSGMQGGIKDKKVIFTLKNGMKCFSDETYWEGNKLYMYAEKGEEHYSILVDHGELEDLVDDAVREHIEYLED